MIEVKAGDCITYTIGKKEKTSWGIVEKVCNANIRVDDKLHYKHSKLIPCSDVIGILDTLPQNLDNHDEEIVDAEFFDDTEIYDDAIEPIKNVWQPREFAQPNVELKSPRIIKIIAGVEVSLWKGYQYSIGIPTESGRIIAESETSGRFIIWLVQKNIRGEIQRGKDVLYLSMHPSNYEAFAAEFPTFTTW